MDTKEKESEVMSYALFAQQKLVLDGLLNTYALQQTQRSNEQNALATQTTTLQRQLGSTQEAQSYELSDMYLLLSHSKKDGGFEEEWRQDMMTGDANKNGITDIDELIPDASSMLVENSKDREQINAHIESMQKKYEQELNVINNKIYEVSVKENAIELEVKRLDTAVTAAQKRLEAIEQAESDAIDRATPKFQGVG